MRSGLYSWFYGGVCFENVWGRKQRYTLIVGVKHYSGTRRESPNTRGTAKTDEIFIFSRNKTAIGITKETTPVIF